MLNELNIFCLVSLVTIYCSSDFANRLAQFDRKKTTTHFQIPVITTILKISTLKLCEMIAVVLLMSKQYFSFWWGV